MREIGDQSFVIEDLETLEKGKVVKALLRLTIHEEELSAIIYLQKEKDGWKFALRNLE